MNLYLATNNRGDPFQVVAHSMQIIDGCLTFWSETGIILALSKGNWIMCELDTEDGKKHHAYMEALQK